MRKEVFVDPLLSLWASDLLGWITWIDYFPHEYWHVPLRKGDDKQEGPVHIQCHFLKAYSQVYDYWGGGRSLWAIFIGTDCCFVDSFGHPDFLVSKFS